jgi:hypothetical protein
MSTRLLPVFQQILMNGNKGDKILTCSTPFLFGDMFLQRQMKLDKGLVECGHFAHQIFSQITGGVQMGIARLAAGLNMGSLRDRTCPQDAYSHQSCFLLSHICMTDSGA